MQATAKETFKAGLKLFIQTLVFLKFTDWLTELIFRQPVDDDLIFVMIAYIAVIWLNRKSKLYRKDDKNDQPKNT